MVGWATFRRDQTPFHKSSHRESKGTPFGIQGDAELFSREPKKKTTSRVARGVFKIRTLEVETAGQLAGCQLQRAGAQENRASLTGSPTRNALPVQN
jgi:hypothetical protein